MLYQSQSQQKILGKKTKKHFKDHLRRSTGIYKKVWELRVVNKAPATVKTKEYPWSKRAPGKRKQTVSFHISSQTCLKIKVYQ